MTFLRSWEASAPGAAAAGVCGDVGQARRAAAQWMKANGAEAGLLEEVRLAIGAASLLPHHERTGNVLRARRYRDGRIRWRVGHGEERGLSRDAPTRRGVPLTTREREATALVAEGLTDRQIASRLCISERTAHAHLRAAFAKTGSRSRVMLVLWVSHQD